MATLTRGYVEKYMEIYAAASVLFQEDVAKSPTIFTSATTTVKTNKISEKFAWLGNTGGLVPWEGDRKMQKPLSSYSFEIECKPQEYTVPVDIRLLESDDIGGIMAQLRSMPENAKKTYEELFVEILTSNPIAYDGQPLFDTAHQVGESGTFSNYASSGAALSITNLKDIITDMGNQKDDLGKPYQVMPTHIMIPPALQFTARAILTDIARSSTTPGDLAVMGMLDIIVNPYLPTAATPANSAYYVMDLSKSVKPVILLERKPLQFDESDQKKFMNNILMFGCSADFGFGPGKFQYIYKAQG